MQLTFLIIFLPVIDALVITPENSAAATPAVTISCPVKNKFLMGVLGFKNSCLNLLGL